MTIEDVARLPSMQMPSISKFQTAKPHTRLRDPAAQCARGHACRLAQKRAQGRPGARCTRGLVRKWHRKKPHTSIQVQRKHSGLPCAMALRLIPRSPRRSGFLVTVACGSMRVRARSGRHATADLTPASRRQDHTTSPSAASPFVSAPFDDSRETRPAIPCAPDAAASTASRFNVRDDRDTPLLRGGMRGL
jgi:hypothetical protein